MPRTFFSSDSYIGHASILSPRFDRPRPFPSIEAHDEALVAAWNAVVRPDDIVWHLGDFAHKFRLDYAALVFSRLKGRKRLVRGNHDIGLGERLPSFTMNDYLGLASALLAGTGIGDLPPIVRPDLIDDGHLVEVMPRWRFRPFDLTLVHLGHRYVPRPVRLFKEMAVEMVPTLFPKLPL